MKLYTKTGDAGETGLFGGVRVPKDDARVEAYGTVDELNAALGLARSESLDAEVDAELGWIQCELFDLGAELATAPEKASRVEVPRVGDPEIERLEQVIDRVEAALPALDTFVLPAGCEAASRLHLCRTICRRAERRVVALAMSSEVRPALLRYLNRLGDLLFSLARLSNARAGVADVPWSGSRRR